VILLNDSDPEKMTATTSICMIIIIGTDDDPYSGRRLNKKVS
jgi:hypothetical protein